MSSPSDAPDAGDGRVKGWTPKTETVPGRFVWAQGEKLCDCHPKDGDGALLEIIILIIIILRSPRRLRGLHFFKRRMCYGNF